MFKISTNLFKEYFPDKKVIYSIEGCDYIKDLEELENLYKLGLRNILLVWNNENKYGSGNKSDKGVDYGNSKKPDFKRILSGSVHLQSGG